MKVLVFLCSAAMIIVSMSCDRNPADSKEMIKNPRTYQWTVDTLAYPGSFQTSIRDIWGSSLKDVYVVGHNDQNRGLMWHFDGKTWTDVKLSTTQGGAIVGPIDLSAIYGFSSNDIWVVGEHIYTNPNRPPNFLDSSLVIHYDGSKWTEAKNPHYRGLFGVWGNAPLDVYVVGRGGLILRSDGVKWSTQFLSPAAALGAFGGDARRLFAGGSIQAGGLDTLVVFTNTGNGWQLINKQYLGDYNQLPGFGTLDFYSPTSGIYYGVGLGIYRWQETKWEKVFPSNIFLNDIYGTGPNNIFVTGQFGKAYHWNGNDWALLSLPFDKIPSDIWLTGVWTDGKEAFICGFGNGRGGAQVSFILHGN